ncbi:MAG: cytochrome c biogenesis protein [Bacillota bacterium]|nr:cytochrome c biogenesis protein [Bacillota bacterium]
MTALEDQYGEKVEFIIADLDNPQSERLAEELPVMYIPAFYFIDENGSVVEERAGIFPFEEMTARIEPLIVVPEEQGEPEEVVEEELTGLERFFSVTVPETMGQKSLLALGIIFIGGVITSISPCILSMIPLLVGYIGGYGGGARSRGFILSLFFVIGLAVTFAIFGFIAASFGRVFGQISETWYYILAVVAIVMGLQLLGFIKLNLPGLKKLPLKKAGPGGALIMGMLFGLVASPCATPVLAVIIAYAAAQAEPYYGSGMLFIYGLGHGLPLLAAGTFTGLARNLPRISRYTQYLSYISGGILVLVGLVLLFMAYYR